jgi:hypothetical protein
MQSESFVFMSYKNKVSCALRCLLVLCFAVLFLMGHQGAEGVLCRLIYHIKAPISSHVFHKTSSIGETFGYFVFPGSQGPRSQFFWHNPVTQSTHYLPSLENEEILQYSRLRNENYFVLLTRSKEGQLCFRGASHSGNQGDSYGTFQKCERKDGDKYFSLRGADGRYFLTENGHFWGLKKGSSMPVHFRYTKDGCGRIVRHQTLAKTLPGVSSTGVVYIPQAISENGQVIGGAVIDENIGEHGPFAADYKMLTGFPFLRDFKEIKVHKISPDGKDLLGYAYGSNQELFTFHIRDKMTMIPPLLYDPNEKPVLMDCCFLANVIWPFVCV